MAVGAEKPVQLGDGEGSAAERAEARKRGREFEEYRAHIGHIEHYDVLTAIQFNLLTALGLREGHALLDVGCGSLRAGRLFIPYLRPGRYFGIEPLQWLVQEGIDKEIGAAMVAIKRPTFVHDEDFTLSAFGKEFDFIIAQSIFSHTSQAQIRRCLAEAKTVLKPEGIFAATFFESPANYEGNNWVAKATYSRDRMRELVEEQGLAMSPIEWRHPDPQQWILIHHPGVRIPLAEATDARRIVMLEEQLATNRQQLMNIMSHPYVRLGLRLKPFLIWLAFTRRRIVRSLKRLFGGSRG
ncbi:MAG: class I SAM-dependent methyltransferase [Betaproteobacteria bacterium]|nr:class I SAM-dependent methyltransferase [Betaproteobacteria bacterium]